jgi:hypothetical protein
MNSRGGFSGYTIVEVMMFLAVSGLLFVFATRAINGQRQRTEFNVAIRAFQSDIENIINDGRDGYYPATDIGCTKNASNVPEFTLGSGTQGQNIDCIMIGKALEFETDSSEYYLHTLAGARTRADGSNVETLAEANPRLISFNTSGYSCVPICESKDLKNGLEVTRLLSSPTSGSPHTPVRAMLLLSSISSSSTSSNINTLWINGTLTLNAPDQTLENNIASLPGVGYGFINSQVYTICLRSPNRRLAALRVGDSNNPISTRILVDSDVPTGATGCPT